MEHLIKVKCIRHVYPDKTEVDICGLDFVVRPGERVVILGPNGAGKTTLLSHILGLLSPVEGQVEVMGMKPDKDFNKVRKHIGIVFQNVDEQIIGPTVFDDIAYLRNEGFSGRKRKTVSGGSHAGTGRYTKKYPITSAEDRRKGCPAGAVS